MNNELLDLIRNRANLNRLNTIELAYQGGLGGQKNFSVQWNGYNSKGQAQVRHKGKDYTVNNAKAYGLAKSRRAVLRVGKNVLDIT